MYVCFCFLTVEISTTTSRCSSNGNAQDASGKLTISCSALYGCGYNSNRATRAMFKGPIGGV